MSIRISDKQATKPSNGPAKTPAERIAVTPGGWRGELRRVARAILRRALFRVVLLALGHSLVFVLVFWTAFCLRFDFAVPPRWVGVFGQAVGFVVALKLLVFYGAGHYHGWWRYVTFADLAALLRAVALSLLGVAAFNHFAFDSHIPRTVIILDSVITVVAIGVLRASWRLFREQFWQLFRARDCRGALLIGTDDSAGLLAHQIRNHPHSRYRIHGFLDLDGVRVGSRLGGIPVLGTPDDMVAIAVSRRITDVLLIAGSVPGKRLRGLIEACDAANLKLKIIPAPEELFEGGRQIPVRDVNINDLLRRDPVKLDTGAIGTLIKGRTVMVTGAGGSIGSEICRQVLRFSPRALVMVGRGENRIFAIERELRAFAPPRVLVPRIADITDQNRLRRIFSDHEPEVIFHAAAHKHVPLMETNAGEAVKNNVYGTKCVADLADEFNVGCFVLISTDKAVYPANVMGATKNLAEKYVLALADTSATRFVVTRFGNVLGSAGSVVPIFKEQIRSGGPITVTDPRMTRYFMTIPEASQLVLQAAAMGSGGEIFVLDMGDPVRIVDLARDLIRLSGLPENAIEIVFSGIRPGEKLFEQLHSDEEETLRTSHSKVKAAYHRSCSRSEVVRTFAALEQWLDESDDAVRAKLLDLILGQSLSRSPTGRASAADSSATSPVASHSGDSHFGPREIDLVEPMSPGL